ncbi:zf-HC2 domain-containing protein [Desulfolucanica intricata]|uniref:zf-HC2 domain-containing protein n=1 Tax=Desulfolucanica intricata TaxID=1285191 RepID=UPI00082E7550|nr:zf-HC2 domain-containing protein [Desulfolucanica intricata]
MKCSDKCSEISELFSPYIDGEIDPEDKKLVEEHLSCCPDCAKELNEWRKMSGLLGEIGSIEIKPPVELRESVMAQINGANKKSEAFKPKGKIAAVFSVSRYKGLVAAAASILILGFGYWGFSSEYDGITKLSAQVARQDSGDVKTSPGAPQDKDSFDQQDEAGDKSQKPPAEKQDSKDNREQDISGDPKTDKPANEGNAPVNTPGTKQNEAAPEHGPVALLSVEKKSLTASIQLAAAEQEAAVAVVKELAGQYQAEYSQQPLEQAVLIQLKVSNQNFAPLLANLEKLGEVKDKKIQEKDLTPQYKQISYEIQDLEEQKKTVENNPDALRRLNAEIEALKVNLAHLDQQAEHAFIAVWIE